MKNSVVPVVICSVLLAAVPCVPATAGVGVSITIPFPPIILPAPPPMRVIPGAYVYYPFDAGVDIFFYHGSWYRPYGGRWYIAAHYNGPWNFITIDRVPGPLLRVPPSYRHSPPGYGRLPYSSVRQHWWTWEREPYRDRHERRGGEGEIRHQGGQRGHGRERGRDD